MVFESVLNLIKSFFERNVMHFTFNYYIKLRYFINNVMYGYNLFLVLLTNDSSSIYLKWSKNEANIIKYRHLYYQTKKKLQDSNNIQKM